MRYLFVFLLFLVWTDLTWAAGNQFNLNFGYDKPDATAPRVAGSGLLKLQLQTGPKFFRGHSGFAAAVGSGLITSEFSLGGSIYPLSSVINSKVQPYFGAEAIASVGSKLQKPYLGGGFGVFSGVDFFLFSKKSGFSLSFEYTQVDQASLRFWIGFFKLKMG